MNKQIFVLFLISPLLLSSVLGANPMNPIIIEGASEAGTSDPSAWSMHGYDPACTSYSPSSAPDKNLTAWITDLPDGTGWASPIVAERKVFIGTGGNFTAWDENSGSLVWSFRAPAQPGNPQTGAVADNRVFFGTAEPGPGGCIYALNTTTGKQIWNFTTEGYVRAWPVVVEDRLYIGGDLDSTGKVYCINATTGTSIWNYTTQDRMTSIAVAYGKVYTSCGHWQTATKACIYCLDMYDGSLVWSFDTGRDLTGSLSVANGKVYSAASYEGWDCIVFALDASSGDVVWSTTRYSSGEAAGRTAVAYGKVFITLYRGASGIYALNETNGDEVWAFPGPASGGPVVADGKVFFGWGDPYNSRYQAVNETTGSVVWSYKLGGGVHSWTSAIANERVFVADHYDSKLYAFGSAVTLPVHNIDTGLDYAAIQEAIDAPETLDGHTIKVDAGTYYEHVTVDKSVSLIGERRQNTIVDGGGDGRIFEISSNVRISEFTIQNGHAGVYNGGGYNTISGNIILNNYFGVDNAGWSHNVSDNFITNNSIGIFLHWSDENIISGNTITYNGRGISLQHACTDNTIINNTITNSEFAGIQILRADGEYPTNNTISGNDIIFNEIGIWLSGASDNSIFHNNFIGNTDQVLIKPEYPSINTWDDGYPSGGNYWSDYIGVDEMSGQNQDQLGSDGIGDTPYVIDEENIDRYPLFDHILVKITSVSISKTVTNNTITYLVATVVSEGPLPFDVSVFYDNTLIGTKTVTELLFPENSMIVTFRWNTTDVPLGKYNISFSISLYPNQKYFAGTVREVYDGDINPDGIINIYDLYVAATAYFSSTIREDINCDGIVDDIDLAIVSWSFGGIPGHPRWNPDADVNEDGEINYFDASQVASKFGAPADPEWNPIADLNVDRLVNIQDFFPIARDFGKTYDLVVI